MVMPSQRVHAVFCAVLAAMAAVPFARGRFMAYTEAMFVALMFLHYLFASLRDMAGSPSVQADVQCATEGEGGDEPHRRHYRQAVRVLVVFATVLTAATAVEIALVALALPAVAALCGLPWLVAGAHDAASMWRILGMYWRSVRRRRHRPNEAVP